MDNDEWNQEFYEALSVRNYDKAKWLCGIVHVPEDYELNKLLDEVIPPMQRRNPFTGDSLPVPTNLSEAKQALSHAANCAEFMPDNFAQNMAAVLIRSIEKMTSDLQTLKEHIAAGGLDWCRPKVSYTDFGNTNDFEFDQELKVIYQRTCLVILFAEMSDSKLGTDHGFVNWGQTPFLNFIRWTKTVVCPLIIRWTKTVVCPLIIMVCPLIIRNRNASQVVANGQAKEQDL